MPTQYPLVPCTIYIRIYSPTILSIYVYLPEYIYIIAKNGEPLKNIRASVSVLFVTEYFYMHDIMFERHFFRSPAFVCNINIPSIILVVTYIHYFKTADRFKPSTFIVSYTR
jgi:hypothetical protein